MLIHFLFLMTGFFGLLTVVIIMTNYSFNRMMNLYLILIFILVAVRFLLNSFFNFGFFGILKEHYLIFSKFSIVIVPSFYLYYKNLILGKKDFFITKELVHFVFPLVFFAINIYVVSIKTFDFISFQFVFYFLFLFYNSMYCFLAFQILKKNIWTKNAATRGGEKNTPLIHNWTLFLFLMQFINTIQVLAALYMQLTHSHIIFIGELFQWITALIWFAIFFKILVSPEILFGLEVFNSKSKDKKDSILKIHSQWNSAPNSNLKSINDLKLKEKVDEKIDYYIDEIERFSIEFQLLKNSNFLLFDLAKKLKIPKSHLGYLFKYHSKISFYDFKNKIRIEYSIRLIESGYLEKHTLDTLAKETGFASYNPFLINFKKIVGISPRKYIDRFK